MNHRSLLLLLGASALSMAACGGGGGGGSSSGSFRIAQVTNGFGPMLPHRVNRLDSNGVPVPGDIVEITEFETMVANVRPGNAILPVVEWDTAPILASGLAGNHYFAVRFSEPLDISSVLSSAVSAAVSNNLTSNIQVVSVDPATGEILPLNGRGFVNGFTFGQVDPLNTTQRVLERWVGVGTAGKPVALTIPGSGVPGLGFPGTEGDETGQGTLVRPDTFVFVRDMDDDLSTGSHETFPTNLQIQLRITTSVRSGSGQGLREAGVASATVGTDSLCPEVLVAAPPTIPGLPAPAALPVIIPGDGELNVDPRTNIEITFTEPVQPRSIGNFEDGNSPVLSGTVQVQFGPGLSRVTVPYSVRLGSVFDLTRVTLVPSFTFPGAPSLAAVTTCGDFSTVDINILSRLVLDLSGNLNLATTTTSFSTGVAPGLVNAPVTPDAIYIGRRGQGISVLDLNGFGQGPGSPIFDSSNSFIPGNTNFLNNPNVALQPNSLIPILRPGVCTFDGGSQGPFTLAVDSNLSDVLVGDPILEGVGDMALGHALDNTFNNGAPFGCQAGGGDMCAITGLKKVAIISNSAGSTLVPSIANNTGGQNQASITFEGSENLVSWAPHPNPPALVFPPLCAAPFIGSVEPTSSSGGVVTLPGIPPLPPTNFLTPGNFPMGNIGLGIAPSSLLTTEQNCFFQGPTVPGNGVGCLPFAVRQQIGQFLYVIDRGRREVVVLNSNRFNVLDRIAMADPTSFAMSPNLNLLAVTNHRANQVSFIDTNPASSTFHQIVKTTTVGAGPAGIAWTPDNEDILVCNQNDRSMTVISAFTLVPRKTVLNQLTEPIDVVISPRQVALGLSRGIYFAYILNANGTIAVFESGPDGVNGIGFDDIVASLPFRFDNPKAITLDPATLTSSFWIAHENQINILTGTASGLRGGAVSRVEQSSGTIGAVPLGQGAFGGPNLRDIQYTVRASIGSDVLTGIPVDIAFDNLKNRGGLPNVVNTFSAPPNALFNGKSVAKATSVGGTPMPAQTPQYMFLAIPNSNEPGIGGAGVVDVINLGGLLRQDTNRFIDGVQSIPAAGVSIVMDYYRQ